MLPHSRDAEISPTGGGYRACVHQGLQVSVLYPEDLALPYLLVEEVWLFYCHNTLLFMSPLSFFSLLQIAGHRHHRGGGYNSDYPHLESASGFILLEESRSILPTAIPHPKWNWHLAWHLPPLQSRSPQLHRWVIQGRFLLPGVRKVDLRLPERTDW